MAQSYPSSWKYCATCAYWGGARESDYFGKNVKVESSMAKGKCLCRASGWRNQDKQASSSCNRYEKWPVLK